MPSIIAPRMKNWSIADTVRKAVAWSGG